MGEDKSIVARWHEGEIKWEDAMTALSVDLIAEDGKKTGESTVLMLLADMPEEIGASYHGLLRELANSAHPDGNARRYLADAAYIARMTFERQ